MRSFHGLLVQWLVPSFAGGGGWECAQSGEQLLWLMRNIAATGTGPSPGLQAPHRGGGPGESKRAKIVRRSGGPLCQWLGGGRSS